MDLTWKERDLPQSIRTKHVHKLHSYMGKFIPQLVEIFLKFISPIAFFIAGKLYDSKFWMYSVIPMFFVTSFLLYRIYENKKYVRKEEEFKNKFIKYKRR